MGATNFGKVNAKNYYAIIPDEDEAEYWSVNEDLRVALPWRGFEKSDKQLWSEYDRPRMSRDSIFFGRKWYDTPMDEFDMCAELCFTPGYYEGGTLDYDITMGTSMYIWRLSEYDSVEDMAEDIANTIKEWWGDEYSDYNADWILDALLVAEEECEYMCEQMCTTTLECVATASNGESCFRALIPI